MALLRLLASAGFRLRHHSDFDWPGVTIGDLLHRRLAARHGGLIAIPTWKPPPLTTTRGRSAGRRWRPPGIRS